MPSHYRPSINLENAKKAVALALAEARKNNWTMAAAIVDGAGNLVYFEKTDDT
jgi:glc operon protein GlcG